MNLVSKPQNSTIESALGDRVLYPAFRSRPWQGAPRLNPLQCAVKAFSVFHIYLGFIAMNSNSLESNVSYAWVWSPRGMWLCKRCDKGSGRQLTGSMVESTDTPSDEHLLRWLMYWYFDQSFYDLSKIQAPRRCFPPGNPHPALPSIQSLWI